MVYNANPIQKKILKIYEELCDEYRSPDVLIANGDLIDGANYKESGLGVFTTDLNLQAELFKHLIDYLKPRKIIGTTGSKYHSGANPNMDQIALEKVGGDFKGGYGIVDVNGCRIYAQHKIAVSKSTWQYRCYSEDTEVLTESGWKLHKDVLEGERIAIYDPKTNRCIFERPLGYNEYDHSGDMVKFQNSIGGDVLVTPNHKMWIHDFKDKFYLREAGDILSRTKRIDVLLSPIFDIISKESEIICIDQATTDFVGHSPKNIDTRINICDWAEFIGYYLSEGGRQTDPSNSNHQITFAQKDEDKSRKMESCFDKIGFHYSKTTKDINRWTFNRKQLWQEMEQFGSLSHLKSIPEFVFGYPTIALIKLYDAMMLGDGTVDKRDRFADAYYTTSLQLANDFQRLATLLGHPARVALHYKPRKEGHKTGYRVYVRKHNVTSLYPELVQYTGKVCCFTTTSGLYLTRRNGGYPTIQVNSTPLGRAIVLARLADETYGKINILCKSHAHYFNYVGFSDCLGMIMPCWKAYDPFGDTAIEFNNPAVGYVVFDVESDGSYQFNYNIQHFKQSELNPDVII